MVDNNDIIVYYNSYRNIKHTCSVVFHKLCGVDAFAPPGLTPWGTPSVEQGCHDLPKCVLTNL